MITTILEIFKALNYLNELKMADKKGVVLKVCAVTKRKSTSVFLSL